MDEILKLGVPWWTLVVRSIVIYAVFFIGLRLFGKREIGQFTLFDLVLLLLVANALQPAITGPDTSLTGGIIVIVVLLLVNRAVAFLRTRIPALDNLIEPLPTTLAREGRWLAGNVHKEGLTVQECEMAMREHGIDKVQDVKLAVLEEDGSISVVGKDSDLNTSRRRRRLRLRRQM
jgi:uncharacterized membrane protein YcaP (DUF421 family)